jgi:hypothetical protein
MPGYSGTPLPQKLGLKPGLRVHCPGMPAEVVKELERELAGCQPAKAPRAPLDFAIVFVKSQAELQNQFAALTRRLEPTATLWVSWPKKTSGMVTDLNENAVRRIGLAAGMVDVKVCAVTELWSGLKFVFRLKDRPKNNRSK